MSKKIYVVPDSVNQALSATIREYTYNVTSGYSYGSPLINVKKNNRFEYDTITKEFRITFSSGKKIDTIMLFGKSGPENTMNATSWQYRMQTYGAFSTTAEWSEVKQVNKQFRMMVDTLDTTRDDVGAIDIKITGTPFELAYICVGESIFTEQNFERKQFAMQLIDNTKTVYNRQGIAFSDEMPDLIKTMEGKIKYLDNDSTQKFKETIWYKHNPKICVIADCNNIVANDGLFAYSGYFHVTNRLVDKPSLALLKDIHLKLREVK